METPNLTESSTKKERTSPRNDYIRIGKETKRRILNEVSKLNKKDYGKSITLDHYLSKAISLLKNEHLEELKSQSLTNQDRLQKKYEEYCQKNGKISKDEFLGILLSGR